MHSPMDGDAELSEVYPLIETPKGQFVAVDTCFMIDENAVYCHPKFRDGLIKEGKAKLTPLELEARKSRLRYVKIEANIGAIDKGAGLAMVTLHLIQLYSGSAASFLEVDRVPRALSNADN